MDSVERDNILFKLEEVYQFFGKKLPDNGPQIWLKVLSGYSSRDISRAFDRYLSVGKTAPKPADIKEILLVNRPRSYGNEANSETHQKCDSRIARAWEIYLNRVHGFDMVKGAGSGNAVDMDFDTALQIVNDQCIKHSQPDAILPQYRINSEESAA